jgi:hypothetical protein
MAALGKSGNPISRQLAILLRFHRLAEAVAVAIDLENLRVVCRRFRNAALIHLEMGA